MTLFDSIEEVALAHIAAAGGSALNPPTLLPAHTMIELSGEAVRARLCAFVDQAGQEWCLRPDITTPIALMVARGEISPGRYHYAGPVYRLPSSGADSAIEFRHLGFEWYGDGGATEDVEALVLSLEAVDRGGANGVQVRVGDAALFGAIAEALPLSPRWQDRLKRSFGRMARPNEPNTATKPVTKGPVAALSTSLSRLSESEARQAVGAVFAISGASMIGGRTMEDIVARLRTRAEDGAPDERSMDILKAYLKLSVPVDDAMAALAKFANASKLKIDPAALQRLELRLAMLKERSPPFWSNALFHPATGRRFEYYDGLVFDLFWPEEPDRPIASGGRYDGLVARLGGAARSAIGASIRADRLAGGARAR